MVIIIAISIFYFYFSKHNIIVNNFINDEIISADLLIDLSCCFHDLLGLTVQKLFGTIESPGTVEILK